MSSTPSKDFRSVPSRDAGAVLLRAFEQLKSEHSDLLRVRSASNLVVYEKDQAPQIEAFVSVLTRVRPGRFFLVEIDENSRNSFDNLNISVRCEKGELGEVYCLEFVQLKISPAEFKQFESVLNAFCYPGVPLHSLIFLPSRYERISRRVMELSDRAFFRSQDLTERELHRMVGEFQLGDELIREQPGSGTVQAVDLNWLALSGWRQEIRNAFATPVSLSLLQRLSNIEIVTRYNQNGSPSWSAYLLCGWLMDRLNLVVSASSSQGFECRREGHGSLVELRLSASASGFAPESVIFRESDPAGVFVAVRATSADKREGAVLFEVRVERGVESIRRSSSEKNDGDVGCLERYYKIGESTENYLSSLREALALRELERGFRGDDA